MSCKHLERSGSFCDVCFILAEDSDFNPHAGAADTDAELRFRDASSLTERHTELVDVELVEGPGNYECLADREGALESERWRRDPWVCRYSGI